MPTIDRSLFTRVAWRDEAELKLATTFSEVNRLWFMDQLAQHGESLIALEFDPRKPDEFVASRAYHKGIIEFLTGILQGVD